VKPRPSASAAKHERAARAAVTAIRSAVITASDTRTRADDASGDLLAAGLVAAGHTLVDRRIVHDDKRALMAAVRGALAAGAELVIVTGGTGVAPRDVTPEALAALGVRELPGYGELFRMQSHALIGAPALLSRALGGTLGRSAIFALPGSTAACAFALPIILEGLQHLLHHLRGGASASARGGHTSP